MAFSLFKKNVTPLTVLEQLNKAALAPDKTALTKITAELDALEATEKDYQEKLTDLEKQYNYNPAELAVDTAGLDFLAAVKTISGIKTEKPVDKAAISKQIDVLKAWHVEYMQDHLLPLSKEIKAVTAEQQAKIAEVENTLETAENTAQVDEVFTYIIAGLAEPRKRYNQLFLNMATQHPKNFNNYGQTIFRTGNGHGWQSCYVGKYVERLDLAAKEQLAKHAAKAEARYAASMRALASNSK